MEALSYRNSSMLLNLRSQITNFQEDVDLLDIQFLNSPFIKFAFFPEGKFFQCCIVPIHPIPPRASHQ